MGSVASATDGRDICIAELLVNLFESILMISAVITDIPPPSYAAF